MLFFVLEPLAAAYFASMAVANPWIHGGYDPNPPVKVKISILSPENNTVYISNVTVNFNVSFVNSTNVYFVYIRSVDYRASWQNESVNIYTWRYYDEHNLDPSNDDPKIDNFAFEQEFVNVPEGKHNITLTVTADGSHAVGITAYYFDINSSQTADFTVAKTRLFGLPLPDGLTVPTPDSPMPIIFAMTLAVPFVAGLLMLFRKHRREAGKA